jgi:Ala-tRNA(Pro) deacylase
MTALPACLRYLDANEVRYTHTSHPVAYTAKSVALAEFMPAHRVAKTVVLLNSDNNFLFVAVPADAYVDLELVRTAIGVRTIRPARESEISSLFPQAEGGTMPPLTALTHVPIYLDRELADQEFIAFPAGTHRDLIHMRVTDFLRLTEPIVGHFSRPDYWERSFAAGF